MAKRKLTPAQRAVALRNLAKARRARKAGAKKKAAKPRRKAAAKPLTNRRRKALGYHKETKMAKRRRKSSRKGRRRVGGGGGRGILSGIDYKNMAGAGAYGWLEKQASAGGDAAYLKKVPLFFEGIGYAGCTAILAHIIGKNVGGTVGKLARHFAAGTFDVAAYKLAKNGKLYESKEEAEAALAGDEIDDVGYDDEVGIELEGDDEISGDDDEVGYGADGIT